MRAVLPVRTAFRPRVVPWISTAPAASSCSRESAALVGRDLEHVQDSLNGVGRHRRALVDRQAPVVVLDHEVGEGAAGVDSEPHAATLTSPGTLLTIRTGARIVNGRARRDSEEGLEWRK